MRLFTTLFALALVIAVPAMAEDVVCAPDQSFDLASGVCVVAPEEAEGGLSSTMTVKVLNRYVGGQGGVFHDEPVAQYDLFVAGLGPCYLDLWVSTGLDDSDLSSNFGDEVNYNIGCAGSYSGFGLDGGVLYIDTFDLAHGFDGDVVDFYVEISRPLGKWTLRLKPEFYYPGGSSLEGGWLVHLKAGREWSLSERFSLSATPEVVYDDGAFGFEPGWFGLVELGLNTRLTDRVTLRPIVKYSTPLTDVSDGRASEWAYGIATSTTF